MLGVDSRNRKKKDPELTFSRFLAFSMALIPPQLLKMTSSAAFRCVQAWLLEKPAVWADEDAPCLAAALMAQRPFYMRPRKDALLEAKRSHQRHLIAQLDEELLDETLRGKERERKNRNLRRRLDRLNNLLDKERERATRAKERVGELDAASTFSAGGWSAASSSSRKRTEIFAGERSDKLGLAQRKKARQMLQRSQMFKWS